MYSGNILTNKSGSIIGGHQKIDRAAYKVLSQSASLESFPSIKEILHFEGINGPDGMKRKSAGKDEPWHWFDPFDERDTKLLRVIENHYQQLVKELRTGNKERAAFEASWLAHAMVDGLTPAHHYPYQEELEQLRGSAVDKVSTPKEKLILKGDTRLDSFKRNWQVWGSKGLLTTHALFELGVATLIAPIRLGQYPLSDDIITAAHAEGLAAIFRATAKEIAELEMYDAYYRKGWTMKLSNVVKKVLAPKLVDMVALAWYLALADAKLVRSDAR